MDELSHIFFSTWTICHNFILDDLSQVIFVLDDMSQKRNSDLAISYLDGLS